MRGASHKAPVLGLGGVPVRGDCEYQPLYRSVLRVGRSNTSSRTEHGIARRAMA